MRLYCPYCKTELKHSGEFTAVFTASTEVKSPHEHLRYDKPPIIDIVNANISDIHYYHPKCQNYFKHFEKRDDHA